MLAECHRLASVKSPSLVYTSEQATLCIPLIPVANGFYGTLVLLAGLGIAALDLQPNNGIFDWSSSGLAFLKQPTVVIVARSFQLVDNPDIVFNFSLSCIGLYPTFTGR